MHFLMVVLGCLTFLAGILMIFSFQNLKKISMAMNRIVLDEEWIIKHRTAIGVLLIGLTCFLFTGAYFIAMYGL